MNAAKASDRVMARGRRKGQDAGTPVKRAMRPPMRVKNGEKKIRLSEKRGDNQISAMKGRGKNGVEQIERSSELKTLRRERNGKIARWRSLEVQMYGRD